VTTNVTVKHFCTEQIGTATFLHGTNHGCTVVSHMCRRNTRTVTGK